MELRISLRTIQRELKTKLFSWLMITMAATLAAFAPFPVLEHPPARARTFRVEASQYAYSPGAIRVNPGDTVTIELVSRDVVHGLFVDDYGVSITADPGQTSRLTFVADKAGSFRMRCNVTCGAMHPFMIGKLNVGVNTWLYRSLALAGLAVAASFILFIPKNKIRQETV